MTYFAQLFNLMVEVMLPLTHLSIWRAIFSIPPIWAFVLDGF